MDSAFHHQSVAKVDEWKTVEQHRDGFESSAALEQFCAINANTLESDQNSERLNFMTTYYDVYGSNHLRFVAFEFSKCIQINMN